MREKTNFTASCLVALIAVTGAQAQDSHPIRKVDHFYAVSPEPRELFEFLNTELQLPEIWPFSDYGSFASGGLSLGNVVFVGARGCG